MAGTPARVRVAHWVDRLLDEAAPARPPGALSVLFCGDRRMRSLNRLWRKKDRPTDVLSFPSGEAGFLGDLVIDVTYAARQARARGHSLSRELQILLAHGLLHLLGHDHETDDGTMFRMQKRCVKAAFGAGSDGVPEGEPA